MRESRFAILCVRAFGCDLFHDPGQRYWMIRFVRFGPTWEQWENVESWHRTFLGALWAAYKADRAR